MGNCCGAEQQAGRMPKVAEDTLNNENLKILEKCDKEPSYTKEQRVLFVFHLNKN